MASARRVAIYGRVSTNSGQNPEMQIRELRDYCKNRGWKIHAEYIDRGISGATDSRPQLNRLMADAHRRRFDVVAVWDFSRFARSTSHLLRALETFSSLGIGFVSLREQIDTSTPTGKMVFTILGSVAELERSLIGERVRAGLRNAIAKGTRLGRPPLRELKSEEIRRLIKDRRSKMSFKALAGKYGVSTWTAFQLCKSKG
jgi:DNA invertase Pin-like site-specific DNA recombinase